MKFLEVLVINPIITVIAFITLAPLYDVLVSLETDSEARCRLQSVPRETLGRYNCLEGEEAGEAKPWRGSAEASERPPGSPGAGQSAALPAGAGPGCCVSASATHPLRAVLGQDSPRKLSVPHIPAVGMGASAPTGGSGIRWWLQLHSVPTVTLIADIPCIENCDEKISMFQCLPKCDLIWTSSTESLWTKVGL